MQSSFFQKKENNQYDVYSFLGQTIINMRYLGTLVLMIFIFSCQKEETNAANSESQIEHTKIERVLQKEESIRIDLNDDRVDDIEFTCKETYRLFKHGYEPLDEPKPTMLEVKLLSDYFKIADKITYDFYEWEELDPTHIINDAEEMKYKFRLNWNNGVTIKSFGHYLGLMEVDNGQERFGWLAFTKEKGAFHIEEMAFNKEPGRGIRVGNK